MLRRRTAVAHLLVTWGETLTDVRDAIYDRPAVARLIAKLQEATRARPRTDQDDDYVPVSGAEVAAADYHHFVYGQRGAGKSSLLRHLEKEATDKKRLTVWIDQEIFSNLEYPDVLVSAVTLIFEAAVEIVQNRENARISKLPWYRRVRERYRKEQTLAIRLSEMTSQLQILKFAPIDRKIEWTSSSSEKKKGAVSLTPAVPHLKIGASMESEKSRQLESRETTEGTKDQYLERALTDLRRILREVAKETGGGIIFVDDLYQIKRANQSLVLGYLHRLVKDTDLWLKIGSIRYSTEPYIDGDPPRGMQSGNDAHEVALDRGMRHLRSTSNFLEKILGKICDDSEVSLKELFTDDARKRLVLAAGGVARDYLRIASNAILEAKNRGPSEKAGSHRVTVEDVNKGAGEIAPSKKRDLQRDEPAEAEALTSLVASLTDFCRRSRSAYFLASADDVVLSRQMDKLQHLRFAHLLFENETIPDQGSERFNVWLLDVAELSAQRATVGMDFLGWENRSKRRSRNLVFSLAN